MAGKERNQVKLVLFIMIGATALLTLMAGSATTATASTPDTEGILVVPVVELPSTPDKPGKLVVPVIRLPSTPDKPGKLVVPVIRLPRDVVARVNEAYWAKKHSQ
jgi:hypothetical protein